MLFVKTKKEGQKTCPNVLNQHHYHRPTPLKIYTFEICHTKNSSDPQKFGFSHLWTFCWSKLIIIIQLLEYIKVRISHICTPLGLNIGQN